MSYITNVIGSIIPGVSVAMVFGALYKKASWQSGVAAIVSGLLFGVSFLAIDSFNAYIKEVFSGPAIPATIVARSMCISCSSRYRQREIKRTGTFEYCLCFSRVKATNNF